MANRNRQDELLENIRDYVEGRGDAGADFDALAGHFRMSKSNVGSFVYILAERGLVACVKERRGTAYTPQRIYPIGYARRLERRGEATRRKWCGKPVYIRNS